VQKSQVVVETTKAATCPCMYAVIESKTQLRELQKTNRRDVLEDSYHADETHQERRRCWGPRVAKARTRPSVEARHPKCIAELGVKARPNTE
jgi:GTP cyclohydrolase FolE2